ncbi:MAG: acetyltransferase component of pyruvate dehydrogenase complex [Alphaproteobacteria bacterium]|nr:MAG: acetyltransferase component of pyruvate dehydrogenase complex [Alphaproteobacteria bacterium]
MPINILMPALSPTMTEGTLAKWHKKEGDEVKAGDVIAEIETDKATMEVEAVDEGVLGRIVVPAGTEGVKVNEVIAYILEEGEDAGGLPKSDAAPAAQPEAPKGERPAEAKPQPQPEAKAGAAAPQPKQPAETARAGGGGERVIASPLARRMAAQAGIDLSGLTGSGPHGRIVKVDIESAMGRGKAAPAAAPAEAPAAPAAAKPAPAPAAGMPAYEDKPLSRMRKAIARRLTEAKRDMPHFYLTVDCEIDALLKMRAELNAKAEGAYKLSVNDFVIRAAALALKKVPAANVGWMGEALRWYQTVDVSVAVAIPDGLITPIVKNADAKGLATIANEMKDLAARARDGKLAPHEYEGGTFSISNLGMYGIREFSAVINPPQAAILAVGAGEQRPVVKGGALAVATVMTCTLSVDHRAIDGAVGAEFLAAFKKLVQEPLTMLL